MPTRVNLDLLSLTPQLSQHWYHTSTIESSKPRKPKLCQELIKYTLLRQHIIWCLVDFPVPPPQPRYCHMWDETVRVDWLLCQLKA